SLSPLISILFPYTTLFRSLLGYIFSAELLLLLGTPESILDQSQTYLQISFLGMFFLFAYNFLNTVLRALGDSKTPMRIVLIAVVDRKSTRLNSSHVSISYA